LQRNENATRKPARRKLTLLLSESAVLFICDVLEFVMKTYSIERWSCESETAVPLGKIRCDPSAKQLEHYTRNVPVSVPYVFISTVTQRQLFNLLIVCWNVCHNDCY